jgi:hypothetical protein
VSYYGLITYWLVDSAAGPKNLEYIDVETSPTSSELAQSFTGGFQANTSTIHAQTSKQSLRGFLVR